MTSTVTTAVSTSTAEPEPSRMPAFAASVFAVAGATVAFHLATAQISSYHRDEPYYLASGRRMAWGYVDHPPITPALYWLSDHLFGTSLLGLRVIPALLHGVTVVLTALLARELGASKRGQLVAAFAAAVVPITLTTGHFLGTVTVEIVFWAALGVLFARLLRTADPRWWVAIGAVTGCALMNKWTTWLLLLGLAVGIVCTPQRRSLRSPWLLAGIALACVIWAPNLWWQARHDFPQFDAAESVQNAGDSLLTIPYQLVILGAASVMLALPGLLWLFRATEARRYRAFAIAFVTIVVLVMLTQAKPYYASCYFPILFGAGAAAGAVASTRWLVAFVAISLFFVPFSTPLVPAEHSQMIYELNPEIGEMVGWPELADTVAGVYRKHPGATILTDNYSEAGIIEMRRNALELPQPISGHMTYWFWGHPTERSDTTIVVGYPQWYLERFWDRVELATTFDTPDDVENEEDGTPIWVATEQRADWDEIWDDVRDP